MTFSVIASLDDDSTLNLCVSVLVDAEFVTGVIQQVAVALAIAELHIGAAGNTPVGNLTDGMSPKKIPEVYSSASEALTLTVLMASLTPLRPKTDQPSIWDTESPRDRKRQRPGEVCPTVCLRAPDGHFSIRIYSRLTNHGRSLDISVANDGLRWPAPNRKIAESCGLPAASRHERNHHEHDVPNSLVCAGTVFAFRERYERRLGYGMLRARHREDQLSVIVGVATPSVACIDAYFPGVKNHELPVYGVIAPVSERRDVCDFVAARLVGIRMP